MKITLQALLCSFCLLSCKAQNNSEIVEQFIKSYNRKDSITTFKILHNDFIELWKKDTVINGKMNYSKNYSWGKIMNDKEEIEIIKTDTNYIETISVYYSDRDKLLGIKPYKSKRVYHLKDKMIIKIIGQEFEGYKEYDEPRRKDYSVFFNWLLEKHNLEASDFPFDKSGAKDLKKKIIEFNKNN